jgi:hypothetical protein
MINQVEPENIRNKNEYLRVSGEENVIVIVSYNERHQIGEVQEYEITQNQEQFNVPEIVVEVNAS